MTTLKKQVNDELKATDNNVTFSDPTLVAATTASDIAYASKATVFGQSANQTVGGITGIESKLNGAGTTIGDTLVVPTVDAVSLSNIPDPSDNLITIGLETKSLPTAVADNFGLPAPTKTLQFEQLGGSSLGAIRECSVDATDKASALQSKIGGVASAVNSESAISVETPGSGILDDIASAVSSVPSIGDVADAVQEVKDASGISALEAQATNIVNDITTSVDDVLETAASGINKGIGAFEKAAGELTSFIEDTAISTGGGLLQDIAESLTRGATKIITDLVDGVKLGGNQLSSILQGVTSGDPKRKANSIKQVALADINLSDDMKRSIEETDPKDTADFIAQTQLNASKYNVPTAESTEFVQRTKDIEVQLSELDTTISGSKVITSEDFFVDQYDIQENIDRYKGAQSAFDAFSYVDSKEELGAEIRKITRDVNEVILHASETYTNQNIGCEEIHVEHNDRGFDGIQYHYVIRRDGRLQRGLPVDKQSDASNISTHSLYSIDICLIGGLNCPTDTPDPLNYRSAQSFTIAQMNTLEAFLEAFYRRYHGGQVLGHMDIQEDALDPYFDVTSYVETLFRKKSVYEDILNEVPQPTALLIKKEPV